MRKCLIIAGIFVLLFSHFADSQITSKGIPWSFEDKSFTGDNPLITVAAPDISTLEIEDLINDSLNLPHRFMEIIPVDIDLLAGGSISVHKEGGRIYRLKIQSQGALAISLYFDRFYLACGTKLFLYDESRRQLKGAFTENNNDSGGLFATELIHGNTVILELDADEGTEENTVISISGFGYAYREIPEYRDNKGFGGSDFCEINVKCAPEGNNWQTVKSGVVRIQVKVSGSAYWCSGSLLNNVRNDKTPYILTADHCAFQLGHYSSNSDLMQWLFYFNYESATCEDPDTEPELLSMLGATKIANGGDHGNTGSDFYLVLLNQNVPQSYQPYFIGWSAINEASQNGVTIHHPEGDIKKISTYNQLLETTNWFNNTVQSHWKVFWTETDNGWGVTEGGSSGSPLFNSAGRIIGTLTGGYSACESAGVVGPDKPDYYGKFSYHWESNGSADTVQLKPWLDPDNTGIAFIDGLQVGLPENLSGNSCDIFLYPNPAEDVINLNFINFEPSKIEIEFMDITGRTVERKLLDYPPVQVHFDLRSYSPGIYMIRLNYNDDRILKRFIKR
ncbi:MAG: T9SS type A sorting domain-containing protein [Bacteroidetes bacterium]|nr:T9SS type A sorting domain-containing protein [Bacteroidota bacterium]